MNNQRPVWRCVAFPFLCLLLASSALAQDPLPAKRVGDVIDIAYQSPTIGNSEVASQVVHEYVVSQPGVDAQSLQFGAVQLAPESRIDILLADGTTVSFTADALAENDGWTGLLQGDSVTIQLVAAPGSPGDSFALLRTATATGEPEAPPEVLACDGDQRIQSFDHRAGRIFVAGTLGSFLCTGFLTSSNAVATAGHCFSAAGSLFGVSIETHVPLSGSNGGIFAAPPDRQYVWAGSTYLSWTDNGIADDWAVFLTRRNAITRLYAGEAINDHFLFDVPTTSIPMRATGYGSDNTPPTHNHAQQTQNGTVVSLTGNEIRYSAHVSPGNSGGPIIKNSNNTAIGIVTHSCGGNGYIGTSITHPAFLAARTNLVTRFTLGSAQALGTSCPGTFVPVCGDRNGSATGAALGNQTGGVDYEFAMQVQPNGQLSIAGFELLLRASQPTTILTRVWSADFTGNPLQLLRTGFMNVGTQADWYRTEFPPLTMGSTILIGFKNPNPSVTLNIVTSGTGSFGASKNPFSSTWNTLFANFAWRILCGPAGLGQPVHSVAPVPQINDSTRFRLGFARPNMLATLTMGVSNTQWGSVTLPANLASWGAPLCNLYVSQESALGVIVDGAGNALVTTFVPNSPSLIGVRVYSQYYVLDPGANSLGLVFTNYVSMQIGGFN